MPKYVICAYRPWNVDYWAEKAPLLCDKGSLETDLAKLNPEWVFFPDWSWKIPQSIYGKYKCVMFHEAPLPLFRGGSPIQNQIIQGIKNTKLTAFLVDGGLDTGDILAQRDLSLEGHLHEIMALGTLLVDSMIDEILSGNYVRTPQRGESSEYKRRTPKESELDLTKPLDYIYDFIRMLEEPYPNAFCYIGGKKLTFKWAEKGEKLTALVEIE